MLFALLHSILASRSYKTWFYSRGLNARTYRLAYVVVAVATTALWLLFIEQLPDSPLYSIESVGRWFMHGVQLAGLCLFWLSLKPVDVPAFLGLMPFPGDMEPFIEQGAYRYVRHPMYMGIMLIMVAWPAQSLNSFNLALIIGLYFLIGSKLEERRMLNQHPEYAEYQQRVPAFIPTLRKT